MKNSKGAARVRKKTAAKREGVAGRSIAAADFKARSLEVIDHVQATGVEYVITKRGKPVAKVMPFTAPRRTPLFGSKKGTVLKFERPFNPLDGN
jgi:prevent-host-death family protein